MLAPPKNLHFLASVLGWEDQMPDVLFYQTCRAEQHDWYWHVCWKHNTYVCFTDESCWCRLEDMWRGFGELQWGQRLVNEWRMQAMSVIFLSVRFPVQIYFKSLAMCQAQIVPDASHMSALRCQYSYWALRILARRRGDPTVHCWFSLIRSLR